MINFFNKIFNLNKKKGELEHEKYGFIELVHGVHEIFIETKKTPIEVILKVDENYPTCSPVEKNHINATIKKNGFLLKVNVKSSKVRIDFILVY